MTFCCQLQQILSYLTWLLSPFINHVPTLNKKNLHCSQISFLFPKKPFLFPLPCLYLCVPQGIPFFFSSSNLNLHWVSVRTLFFNSTYNKVTKVSSTDMIVGRSNLTDVEERATRCGKWQYGEMKWWKIKTK